MDIPCILFIYHGNIMHVSMKLCIGIVMCTNDLYSNLILRIVYSTLPLQYHAFLICNISVLYYHGNTIILYTYHDNTMHFVKVPW